MLAILLLLGCAYLSGSIPTGVWLSLRHGVDPRDIGSGNIGATNVARAAGLPTGVLTLAGDALKGLLPVLFAVHAGYAEPIVAITALTAFIGHLYSCFLGFRGGKGVATALGVFLGLAPLAMAVVVPLFVATAAISRYVSLASLLAAAVTPVVLILLGCGRPTLVVALIIGVLIVLRHRDNIRRMRFGTEARIGAARPSGTDSDVA
jgi:glycerol-3-phosphate acyltransferase PlsY